MDFYKYVSAERIDILKNRLIRFTQVEGLNDPFEAQPYFDELKSKKGFAKGFAETVRQVTQAKWQDIRIGAQTDLDRQAFAEKVEKDYDYVEELRHKVDMPPLITEAWDTADQLSKIVGVLSLSDISDNLLMWAHYAGGHTGFVIILDGSHDFFRGGNSLLGFAKPEDVKYYSERPSIIFGEENLLKIFLMKGSDWKYEKEWRYLKDLNAADKKIIDANSHDVHLFRLPPKCIKGVILGCESSENLKDKISAIKRDEAEFNHLRVQQACASETEYRLEITEIET